MIYNSTDGTSICEEIDSICGSNSVSYALKDKNRRLNSALDDYVLLAVREASGWSIEDSAETDLPIATRNLTSGQSDYAFPTESLVIEKLEILLDNGSTWQELEPTDQLELNQGSGIPTKYKKVGNSFIFNVSQSYSETSGIKVHYRRAFNYSTLSGTTFTPTSPGIPSVFHTWLARKAALPELIDSQKASKNDVASLVQEGNQLIISYFGRRPKDVQRRMSPARENNK